jgi:AmmeMemoRadiSam system protein B
MIRQPFVAGQFYPADPDELAGEIARHTVAEQEPISALAVVVPHAGYIFSGSVAGAVYSRVKIPERAIILGVNHQGYGANAAVIAEGAWAMPQGNVPIDSDLARAVMERSSTLEEDPRAHLYEHSLEVQVPFLQHFQPDLRVVPIALYRSDSEACRDVGQACAEAVRQADGPVLLVASTDLSHEERDYEKLKTNDRPWIPRVS